MKKHFCEEDGGRSLQSEGAQKAPELLVSQTLAKEKEAKEEKQKNKVVGWFSKEMEEKTSKRGFQDTEEMEGASIRKDKFVAKVLEKTMKKRQWRSRKRRRGREPHTKEDVIHWNGDMANVSNNINLGSGVKTVGRDLFPVSGKHHLQQRRNMH